MRPETESGCDIRASFWEWLNKMRKRQLIRSYPLEKSSYWNLAVTDNESSSRA